MKRLVAVVILAGVAVGCRAGRGWESMELPTRDRQRAFDAAQETLEKYFGAVETNWTKGTLETRPQLFDRKREGMVTDLRGAGGRWRRTVSCVIDRSGMEVTANVAVRLEREATVAAAVMTETGQPENAERSSGATPGTSRATKEPGSLEWTDAGYDESLAREILGEIARRVRDANSDDVMPDDGPSVQDMVKEAREIGSHEGP